MKPQPYGPFPYVPITRRPEFNWPGGGRVAIWVMANFEYFPYDQPVPDGSGLVPDVPTWSRRDYGNRIGVFRIFDVLDDYGIRATVTLNSDLCDVHQEVIDEALRRDWEIMGHGESNSRALHQIPPEDEQGVIHDSLARIEKSTGARPRGWMGPGMHETWNTLDYLAAEGIEYVADWINDDQCCLIDAGDKKLVSLPYGENPHDKAAFTRYRFTPDDFALMITDHFDVLHREGGKSGRVMTIALHPFVIGLPHRIGCLRKALDHIVSHDGAWFATGGEIVDHFLESGATF